MGTLDQPRQIMQRILVWPWSCSSNTGMGLPMKPCFGGINIHEPTFLEFWGAGTRVLPHSHILDA
jgi:hypothetical protein